MEVIVGLLFWGGLLALAIRWVMRLSSGQSLGTPVRRQPAAPPTPRPSTAQSVSEESGWESGALVDGLIIGHHLTRTHYEDRLAAQAETIDAPRAGATEHAYLSDDVEDPDDLDAMGGYGAAGFAGGSSEAGSNELDEFEAAEDPWEDDTFGYDDGDDY